MAEVKSCLLFYVQHGESTSFIVRNVCTIFQLISLVGRNYSKFESPDKTFPQLRNSHQLFLKSGVCFLTIHFDVRKCFRLLQYI